MASVQEICIVNEGITIRQKEAGGATLMVKLTSGCSVAGIFFSIKRKLLPNFYCCLLSIFVKVLNNVLFQKYGLTNKTIMIAKTSKIVHDVVLIINVRKKYCKLNLFLVAS